MPMALLKRFYGMVVVGMMRLFLGVPVIPMRDMGMVRVMVVALSIRAMLMAIGLQLNMQMGMAITMMGVPNRAMSGRGPSIN